MAGKEKKFFPLTFLKICQFCSPKLLVLSISASNLLVSPRLCSFCWVGRHLFRTRVAQHEFLKSFPKCFWWYGCFQISNVPLERFITISVEEKKDQGVVAVGEDKGAQAPLGMVDVISLTKSFWKKLWIVLRWAPPVLFVHLLISSASWPPNFMQQWPHSGCMFTARWAEFEILQLEPTHGKSSSPVIPLAQGVGGVTEIQIYLN